MPFPFGKDDQAYKDYLDDGGTGSFREWKAEGKPKGPYYWSVSTPADLAALLNKPAPVPSSVMTGNLQAWLSKGAAKLGGSVLPPKWLSTKPESEQRTVGSIIDKLVEPPPTWTPTSPVVPSDDVEGTKPLTAQQALDMLNKYYGGEGKGYRIVYDDERGGWTIEVDPYFETPAQKSEREYYTGKTAAEAAEVEAKKQEQLATLRANPASWLEYASLAGTIPGIQPWMLPLMPQQYLGAQAGQEIPGYQAGGQTMNLPQLKSPSRQYQARMGPSALQQYESYERARTGITPEELQWRLWSQAPPGGRFGGLSWQR